MVPKTIRLRPQDQADLDYLTLVTGFSEGALIRFLLTQSATFVRREAVARAPALRDDPTWMGGTGAVITPADRHAWGQWCATSAVSRPPQEVPHE